MKEKGFLNLLGPVLKSNRTSKPSKLVVSPLVA